MVGIVEQTNTREREAEAPLYTAEPGAREIESRSFIPLSIDPDDAVAVVEHAWRSSLELCTSTYTRRVSCRWDATIIASWLCRIVISIRSVRVLVHNEFLSLSGLSSMPLKATCSCPSLMVSFLKSYSISRGISCFIRSFIIIPKWTGSAAPLAERTGIINPSAYVEQTIDDSRATSSDRAYLVWSHSARSVSLRAGTSVATTRATRSVQIRRCA